MSRGNTNRMAAATVALTLCLGTAASARAGECVGVTLPDRVQVAGTALQLNGMGIREATVFNVDVYVAGLYVKTRTRSPNEVIASEQAKRLILRFVRDVDRSDIAEAFDEGFQANAPRK